MPDPASGSGPGSGPAAALAYHRAMIFPPFPDTDTTLGLPGPVGVLDVHVEPPDPGAEARPVVAVICHPLSTQGGSMHNKVVTMAARALRESGLTTVRFDFRGVGGSEGSFDEGRGEADDLRAVVAWVRAQRPEAQLWLAGFSFGAYVSLSVAAELAPAALISIAPPAGRWDFDAIRPPTMPWLVLQGEEDEVVDPQAVYDWLERIEARAELVRMPETSHFFHRKLMDLRGALKHWAQARFPAP